MGAGALRTHCCAIPTPFFGPFHPWVAPACSCAPPCLRPRGSVACRPKSRSVSLPPVRGSCRGGWRFVLRVLVLFLRRFLSPSTATSSPFALHSVALERLFCCVTPTNASHRTSLVCVVAAGWLVVRVAQRVHYMSMRLSNALARPLHLPSLSPTSFNLAMHSACFVTLLGNFLVIMTFRAFLPIIMMFTP